MERLRDRLTGHAVIALDTSIFIYHLEAHPRYQPLTHHQISLYPALPVLATYCIHSCRMLPKWYNSLKL
jgi:hypothetical protein